MKLIKALVVMLVAVGMILPAVAMAEDRLSLSGEMRVRGWYDDSEIDFDYANNKFEQTNTWADQRLRIAGKIAVAEGVSITFRTDITEQEWGAGSGDYGQNARSGANQQWDRAHIDLTKGDWHLRIGQQFFGTGTAWAFDSQDPGITVDYTGVDNVGIKAFFVLDNQNSDGDFDGSQSDAIESGIKISPKGDNWNAGVFVVNQNNKLTQDENVYLIGANGNFDFGFMKLVGEVDYFTGDYLDVTVGDDIDATGLQVFLDASMAATDTITVGAQFYYAQAADNDEQQYTILGNGFNGWDPIFDVGTQLSNESIDMGDSIACDAFSGAACGTVFDFTGQHAGVIGGRLYGNFKVADATIGASVAYLTNEDDGAVWDFNGGGYDAEGMFYAAGLVYPIMDNTTFQLQVQYKDVQTTIFDDSNGPDIDVTVFQAGTGVFVKF